MKNILLVDCNNFFASCEQLYDPSLKGKAVCVLSNNDGCIVARSNEAKDMGIKMGMPYFIAKKKFKKAVYLSGNRNKYLEVSKKIMRKLKDFTPAVEAYSIDEAFLDVTGVQKLYKMNPVQIADMIRKTIIEEIGIEVSIGVSSTKTLSKIASEIAKNNTRHHIKTGHEGVFEINEDNLSEILSATPIEEVWGIGKNLHKFFRKHNVQNALCYSNLDSDFIRRNLGKKGLELKDELNGIQSYEIVDYYVPPKSISRTSSFKEFSDEKEFVKNELNNHLHRACAELRRHNLKAYGLSVMLRYKDFRIVREKVTFDTPKNSEFELYKEMHKMFEGLFEKGIVYRSSGVCLFRLSGVEESQLSIFEDEAEKKKRKLSCAWDKIEQKFGYGAISIGMKDKK